MNSIRELHRNANEGFRDASLAAHFDTFTQYLFERRYSAHSVNGYQASVSHFACWMRLNRLAVKQIDEALVGDFLIIICRVATALDLCVARTLMCVPPSGICSLCCAPTP